MSDFDSAWKEALERYFEFFMAFFFPEAYADIDWKRGYEFLDKELQAVVPEAERGRRVVDKLVKVWRKGGKEEWVLIHIEVQSQEEKDFAKRMYVYHARLFDRYDRLVVSLAILGDDRANWRPSRYSHSLWGCSLEFTFPPAKLLDYAKNWQALEVDPNPFAVVVMAQLKARETRDDPAARQGWKVRLVKGLYERGLTGENIRQLYRFINWVIDLPKPLEMAFVQEIDRYLEEKRMPAMPHHDQVILSIELHRTIEPFLRSRFGAEGMRLMPEIREIEDVDRLRAIVAAIETAATPDDLRRIWAPS